MKRLAEIERVVNAGDYPCAYCPDLLTALREAQEWATNCQADYDQRYDALEDERDTLQRRVEALEATLRATLVEIHYNHGCDAECEAIYHAALRGSCPACGESMDGIQHGKSECNVDLRGGETDKVAREWLRETGT